MDLLVQQVCTVRDGPNRGEQWVEINGRRWIRNPNSEGPDRFWHLAPPAPRYLGNPALGPVPTTD